MSREITHCPECRQSLMRDRRGGFCGNKKCIRYCYGPRARVAVDLRRQEDRP